MSLLTARIATATALALLIVATSAAAHESASGLQAYDSTITITPDADPVAETAVPGFTFQNRTGNDWFQWRLDTSERAVVLDYHLEGDFGLARPEQMVPFLIIDDESPGCEGTTPKGLCDYPLFIPAANARVWEAQGDARVFHLSGTLGDHSLMLRVPGPVNATLVLQRDTTAPTFTIDEPREITHYGFLRDTRTSELVTAVTQVRRVGATEWVEHPTPTYHHIQHFPLGGLAADTEHEVRTVFTDWAGNNVTSDIARVRTLAAPALATPVVTVVYPSVNGTLPTGGVTNLTVRFETLESPIPRDGSGVLLFLDKKPIVTGFVTHVDDANRTSGTIVYTPAEALGEGVHNVRFEITNEVGGKGAVDWGFVVGAPAARDDDVSGGKDTPAPTVLALVLVSLATALASRRTR